VAVYPRLTGGPPMVIGYANNPRCLTLLLMGLAFFRQAGKRHFPACGIFPGMLPLLRWALTPPFHPYPAAQSMIMRQGGIFSVALSVPAQDRARVLPGIMPCGARTFLQAPKNF